MMRPVLAGVAAFSVVLLLGCVIRTQHTIDAHVRLDIRYIQDQADDVLDFIEGERETLPALTPAGRTSALRNGLECVWDAVAPIRVAHAQELKTTSPAIRELATRMRDRHPEVEALKTAGAFGENNRGYLALFENAAVAAPERKNAAQQLLAAENADRKALYAEIARLNADQRISVSQVERIYAQRRLERGRSGELFQLPGAGEDLERFRRSEMGRELGDRVGPEVWVTLP